MIVASLVLILVAVTLLVLGLASGSSLLLVGSIVASLLAAVALVVGARQAAATRAGDPYSGPFDPDGSGRTGSASEAWYGSGPDTTSARSDPEPGFRPEFDSESVHRSGFGPSEFEPEPGVNPDPDRPAGRRSSTVPVGRQPTGPDDHPGGGADPGQAVAESAGGEIDDDPPDEPPVEETGVADHARLAGLETDVTVVDGRPRYHQANCPHLMGRDGEPLPLREALELGFTPCALCQPNRTLLAESGRV